MSMRGLRKLTAVANTLQAREDWEFLAREAVDLGMEECEIAQHMPNPQDGWRKIDKCIKALRAAIERRRGTVYKED